LSSAAAQPMATNGGDSDTTNLQRQVYELYGSGKIAEAEHLAFSILDAQSDLTRLDRAALHTILAFCAIANADEESGVRRFVNALQLNPDLTPDPITWSPKVRRAFERAYQEYLKKTEQERQYQGALEAGICRDAASRSLYMPGLGQRLKGQPVKGTMMTALFWVAVGTFIYSEMTLPEARQQYHDAQTSSEAQDRWRDYRNWYRMALVSGSAAAVVYGGAFVDALWTKSDLSEKVKK